MHIYTALKNHPSLKCMDRFVARNRLTFFSCKRLLKTATLQKKNENKKCVNTLCLHPHYDLFLLETNSNI